MPRLILDIDGVLCNFVQGMIEYVDEVCDEPLSYCCWKDVDTYEFFDLNHWQRVRRNDTFWAMLRQMPGVRRKMIANGVFPDMYLTARPVGSHVTEQWLYNHMFPQAAVVTVLSPLDKIEHLEAGDVLVDDHPATVKAAQDKGVIALLMDAPFHRGCTPAELAGLARISCISEVAQFIS